MRTRTAQQDIDLAALAYDIHTRVEVQNADATWIELTDDPVGGLDWVVDVAVEEDVDRPVIQATLNLVRDRTGTSSLSPIREDSPLNVDDLAAYAPLVNPGRGLRVNVAQVAAGVAPLAGDYEELFLGSIDTVEVGQDPMVVTARDAIGKLLTTSTVEARATYGTAAGRALELVIQDILTAWAPGVTLLTPSSPGFLVKPYVLDGVSVLQAVTTLAALIGWVCRVRWDDGVSGWRLVLEEPDRAATVPDWTFDSDDYFDLAAVDLNVLPVRNAVEVVYYLGGSDRSTVGATDATSIANYGRQFIRVSEPRDSPIDTALEAQDMADALLADTKEPDVTHEADGRMFWPVQIRDLLRYTGNASQYNVNQDVAVFGYRHELSGGSGETFLRARGKPAGLYRYWQQLRANREPDEATIVESRYIDTEPQVEQVRGVDGASFPGYFVDVHFNLGPDGGGYYVTVAYNDGAPQTDAYGVVAGVSGELGVHRVQNSGGDLFVRDSYTAASITWTPKIKTGLTPLPHDPGGKVYGFGFSDNSEDEGVVGTRVDLSGTVYATDKLLLDPADFGVNVVGGRPQLVAIAAGTTLGGLTDVTLSAVGTGEILQKSAGDWINRTLAEAGISAVGHAHSALDITSGTLPVTRGGTSINGLGSEGRLLVSTSPSAMATLDSAAAGGYLRSNGTTWVRVGGVAAADVVAGTFGAGDYTFPSDVHVTGQLGAGGTGVPNAFLATGDMLAGSGVLAFGVPTSGSVDHIWWDDTNNIYHFVGDTTRLALGNARIRVGAGTAAIPALAVGDDNTGLGLVASRLALIVNGVVRASLDTSGNFRVEGDVTSSDAA